MRLLTSISLRLMAITRQRKLWVFRTRARPRFVATSVYRLSTSTRFVVPTVQIATLLVPITR